jgi:hypothetical protein
MLSWVGRRFIIKKGGDKKVEDTEEKQIRLSCLSMAIEVIKHEPNTTKADILPLAKEMYEWVKGDDVK